MYAQTQYLDGDLLEGMPTIALFLALVLTALGVIAHATFA
jgi:cell division protein FtsL